MIAQLKAPFPYFGGKRQIASRVWELLGEVDNYVEPFCGSMAVLLARPGVATTETVNDWSCLLINAWRAIQNAPELAELLVAPVSEVETEGQHWALVTGAKALRDKLGDPSYFDLRLAAFYIKGANEWIGSGWAVEEGEGPWSWSPETGWQKRQRRDRHKSEAPASRPGQLPHLGDAGTGINRQLPHLGNAGTGINRKLPHLGDAGKGQFSERVEWVGEWLNALRDRLCRVRIACGDFERVLQPSITTKNGLTGVFLDPPYDGTEYVYGKNGVPLSVRVRDWCRQADPALRIVLAGRGTEHDELLAFGWQKEIWTAGRGYSGAANQTRAEEALWTRTPEPVAQPEVFEWE